MTEKFNVSGSKYLRKPILTNGFLDTYAVMLAFDVTCPARQHAIKKLLCSGLRGKGNTLQDLREAKDAVSRAIQLRELVEKEANSMVKYVNKESTEEPKKEYPKYEAGVEYLIGTILHLDNEGIVKVEKGKGCSSCVFWETICDDRKCIARYRADKQDIHFTVYKETEETK